MADWTTEKQPFGQNRAPALTALANDGSGVIPVAVDPTTGRLLVNATGSSGGTSSTFGATFPTTGTAVGASDGTNMQPLLVDGSGYLKINLETAIPAGTNGIGNVGTVSAVVNVAQVTVNTTAVQLSASSTVPKNGILVRALSTNAASIFVGGSGVTTSTGFELVAGETTSFTCNLNTLYIISVASTTDKCCYNVE